MRNFIFAEHGDVIYKSRFFWFWTIALVLAGIAVPFLKHFIPTAKYIIVAGSIIYILSGLTLSQFAFYPDCIVRTYPFFFWSRRFSYENIYGIEIRNLGGAYQQPYVILNFRPNQVGRWFGPHRSFVYKNENELAKLKYLFKQKGIKLTENIEQ